MSSQAARGEHAALRSTLGFALRLSAFIAVPAAVGLVALARADRAAALRARRSSARPTSRYTAQALVGYAVGLPAFSATRIAAQTFYALGDTRTPVLVGFVSVAANVVFALVLMGPLEHMGLALASSLSAYVNLVGLAWLLRPPARRARGGRDLRSLARTLGASAGLGSGASGRRRCSAAAPVGAIAALVAGRRAVYGGIALAPSAGAARSARDAAPPAEPCPSARGGARLRHAPEVLGDRPGQGLRISEGPIPGRRCFPPSFPQTVMDPVTEYLETLQMERGASRNTLAAYRRDLADFAASSRAPRTPDRGGRPARARALPGRPAAPRPRRPQRGPHGSRPCAASTASSCASGGDPPRSHRAPRQPAARPVAAAHAVGARTSPPSWRAPTRRGREGLRDRALLELLYACGHARLRGARAAARGREPRRPAT